MIGLILERCGPAPHVGPFNYHHLSPYCWHLYVFWPHGNPGTLHTGPVSLLNRGASQESSRFKHFEIIDFIWYLSEFRLGTNGAVTNFLAKFNQFHWVLLNKVPGNNLPGVFSHQPSTVWIRSVSSVLKSPWKWDHMIVFSHVVTMFHWCKPLQLHALMWNVLHP